GTSRDACPTEINPQMLGFAWLTLRQAQEALKNGRLEDAHRLLGQPSAQGHKRSWALLQQLAQEFVERAEQRLRQDDVDRAWHDLLQAEQLGLVRGGTERLRQALVGLGLVQVRALLEMGEPSRAADAILQLSERRAQHPEMTALEEVARGWVLARELAARGEFARGLETVNRVRRLVSGRLPAL